MGRIIVGLFKGALLGGAAGYLAGRAGLAAGPLALALYAAIGAGVGLVCGKPLWRQETIWTPVLKAVFGAGIGLGLAFLARRFLGGAHLPVAAIPGSENHALPEVPALLGPMVGALYGMFVELDDGGGAGGGTIARGPSAPPNPRDRSPE